MCQKEGNRMKETNSNAKDWQDGGISSFEQTCFADYWSNDDESSSTMNIILPCISSSSGTPTIDPYKFGHRMALGKCLIESVGSTSIWGDAYEKHWYWGYLAQLDWQWRTGRLLSPSSCKTTTDTTTDTTTTTNSNEALPTTEISTESWFGYMNLNFSVAAYMGAAKAQLVPSVNLLDSSRNNNKNKNKNVEDVPGFQICVDLWYSFWTGPHAQYLVSMENTTTSKAEGDDGTKPEQEALIALYRELWETHTSIIQAGLQHAKKQEALLPDFERQFGLGWCHMVELLAAMGYTLLSLEALMMHGAGYLPSRVLIDASSLEDLKQHKPDEHQATQQILDLYHATPKQLESMCGFFRRLTRWEWERQQMPITLKALNKGSTFTKIALLIRILIKITLPHPTKSTLLERSFVALVAAVATGAWYMQQ